MTTDSPDTGQQMHSLATPDGTLESCLLAVPIPEPRPHEVVIRVEASPINPSDLGLLFAGADMGSAKVSGPVEDPVVTASIPAAAIPGLASRVGKSLPVGNEGAGTVVRAGSSAGAQALAGRTVAVAGGGMYAQDRRIDARPRL